MKDLRWMQERCRKLSHPVPGTTIPLASLHERASPQIGHIVSEDSKASAVVGTA